MPRGWSWIKPSSRTLAAARVAVVPAAVIVIGTAGYGLIEGVGVLDALYMTVITVTTVGFAEVFPLSRGGRVFTIALSLVGVGVIFFVATQAAQALIEGGVRRFMGMRKELRMLRKLTDHTVVCGYGRMGRYVVNAFRERSVPFVVVEEDLETCRELEEEEIPYIHGDASQPEILEAARVGSAATIIICVATDALTVYTVLLARQLNPAVTVIARAVEDDAEHRLELAGADRVINPYRVGGMRLAFSAIKPMVMDFIEGSIPGVGGGLELAEIRVRGGSSLVGRSIIGADIRRRLEIIVIGLVREGESSYNPNPETVIEAGDVLVVLGSPPAVEKAMEACAGGG